jgi:hypothetical protein
LRSTRVTIKDNRTTGSAEAGEDQLRVDHLMQEAVSDLERAGREGIGGERDRERRQLAAK